MSHAHAAKPENPLIVQGDHTMLAEVASSYYEAARDGLSRFAELVKAPEHVHTYRVTSLSIWNACAAGVSVEEIAGTLQDCPNMLCRATCCPRSAIMPLATGG